MDQILNRPEIQSAVVPFVVALLAYIGLRKISTLAWLWAILAAFLVSVVLINGLTVTPLTGTRKIILLVMASIFAAALLPGLLPRVNLQRAIAPRVLPYSQYCGFSGPWLRAWRQARSPSSWRVPSGSHCG